MKIFISDKSFRPEYITVQVYEDSCLVYCNHDGAEIEDVDFGYYENEDWESVLVCNKCDAVQNKFGEWRESWTQIDF